MPIELYKVEGTLLGKGKTESHLVGSDSITHMLSNRGLMCMGCALSRKTLHFVNAKLLSALNAIIYLNIIQILLHC